jgi:hypothetical protein
MRRSDKVISGLVLPTQQSGETERQLSHLHDKTVATLFC